MLQYHQIDKNNTGISAICPLPNCGTKIIPVKSLLGQEQTIENYPDMISIDETAPKNDGIFFKIDDVWDFDNIGVSRPAEGLKEPVVDDTSFKIERLLICGECDKGPLGFAGHIHGEKDVKQLKYFLCASSVLYG